MSQQCCSRRCLSYSYKCVPDHSIQPVDGIQSSVPIATIPQNVITIDELINNRFGESSSTTNTCLSNGVSCADSNKCCSRYCAQATLNSRICAQRGNDVRPQVPQQTQPPSSALLPQVPQTPPPFFYPTGTDTDTSDECEPIGHKVSWHDNKLNEILHKIPVLIILFFSYNSHSATSTKNAAAGVVMGFYTSASHKWSPNITKKPIHRKTPSSTWTSFFLRKLWEKHQNNTNFMQK